MYIVYTQIHDNGAIERWYYGTYDTREQANEVAYELGGSYPVFHGICKVSEAKQFNILNFFN